MKKVNPTCETYYGSCEEFKCLCDSLARGWAETGCDQSRKRKLDARMVQGLGSDEQLPDMDGRPIGERVEWGTASPSVRPVPIKGDTLGHKPTKASWDDVVASVGTYRSDEEGLDASSDAEVLHEAGGTGARYGTKGVWNMSRRERKPWRRARVGSIARDGRTTVRQGGQAGAAVRIKASRINPTAIRGGDEEAVPDGAPEVLLADRSAGIGEELGRLPQVQSTRVGCRRAILPEESQRRGGEVVGRVRSDDVQDGDTQRLPGGDRVLAIDADSGRASDEGKHSRRGGPSTEVRHASGHIGQPPQGGLFRGL